MGIIGPIRGICWGGEVEKHAVHGVGVGGGAMVESIQCREIVARSFGHISLEDVGWVALLFWRGDGVGSKAGR